MNFKKQISGFVLMLMLICMVCIPSASVFAASDISSVTPGSLLPETGITGKFSKEINSYNELLLGYLKIDDLVNSRIVVNKILQKIEKSKVDKDILSESSYLIGIYFLKVKNFNEAISYLNKCISLKEEENVIDERYAKAIYNLSVVYATIGDIKKFETYAVRSLEIGKKIFKESDLSLVVSYLSVAGAYIGVKEYEKAIINSNIAIALATKNPQNITPSVIAALYQDLGVCYSLQSDWSKAKIYLEKTESIYINFNLAQNEDYINLLNGLALTNDALGLKTEAARFYEKGVSLAKYSKGPLAFNIIYGYASFLGTNNESQKGEKLLEDALMRAKKVYKNDPANYFEVLNNFASYLREYKIDNKKSIQYYEECLSFLRNNDQLGYLKYIANLGYSKSLNASGEPEKALEVIQSLLFSNQKTRNKNNFENPSADSIKPDINNIRILRAKYEILRSVYKKNNDQKAIIAASNTSEVIVALLDKLRINISEEESRLFLGDRYRTSYLNAIRDFNLLYTTTGDHAYLEKAFEYSEKSKVAGLLTATRELKASQFHIPPEISNLELGLQREIGLYNVRISEESSVKNPDDALIRSWKENLLEATRKRDSLILIFEKQYPEYYSIKYNTKMLGLDDITSVIGRKGNYINYIVSDSVLYTFIANTKNQKLIVTKIDSSFFNNIKKFRNLLSMPSPSDNASEKLLQYQSVGHQLYKTLIDPVKAFLISDKVYISPDNILSYVPFEAIPTASAGGKENTYRELNYLMNEYDISYTYSATLMAEFVKKDINKSNTLIAFAPSYPEPINIQSVLMSRQSVQGVLNDLPYARKEAEYVADLTGGKLYENGDARESVYKQESGKYDIIHLAMHTLLNDKDPMRSTLIFSQASDSIEDGYLKTYEVYGIPLKAKMVVLSSCNTGSGLLLSGEGIISLARGFIFSGSQSVVMSMWEIEDKSGTDIVEMFYKYLKEGYTKSAALKKARMNFLKSADLLRAHPYFWSTLVVYGDNSPLYHSQKVKIIVSAIFAVLLLSAGFYFWRRRYS
jgi:CHAT domain-containing protein/tetratricopeptide (TPR) repeat protein